jgi:hypothetical protein
MSATTGTFSSNVSITGTLYAGGTTVFASGSDNQTLSGQNFGVRVRGITSGNGIIQFMDSAASAQWNAIIATGYTLPLEDEYSNTFVRVNAPPSGGANVGLISYGTAAPGTLAIGQIYFQTN